VIVDRLSTVNYVMLIKLLVSIMLLAECMACTTFLLGFVFESISLLQQSKAVQLLILHIHKQAKEQRRALSASRAHAWGVPWRFQRIATELCVCVFVRACLCGGGL